MTNSDVNETERGATDEFNRTWVFWSENDKNYHIDYLEILAIKHGVMIYANIRKGWKHIRIKPDNTTAIAYIDTVSESCNYLLKPMWYYCINGKTWISAVHIPGKDNKTADYMCRLQSENTEWRSSSIIFHRIFEFFYCKPEIVFFVS